MPRRTRRPASVSHIEDRVRLAREEGIVYESIEELLLDEALEERGLSGGERASMRKRRVAVVGAGGDVGAGVVSELAQNDFDVIAFVEKVKEAVETLDRISEALREYRGARIKIVADKLDDEDKAAKLFLRVSQVVRIWEAKKAYGEAKAAADYFEKTLRPSLVLANACRRSKVDRIILASGDAPEKPGRLKISQEVLNVVRGGGALSEEAIRQSGVPCVKANLPAAKQAGSGLEGVAAAVGMLSHIISHKAIVGAEVSVPKQALSKAKGAQAMPRAFVLRSFAKANAGKA